MNFPSVFSVPSQCSPMFGSVRTPKLKKNTPPLNLGRSGGVNGQMPLFFHAGLAWLKIKRHKVASCNFLSQICGKAHFFPDNSVLAL